NPSPPLSRTPTISSVPRLQDPSIVAPTAIRALMIQKVIGNITTLFPTILTEDIRAPRRKLRGHGVGLKEQVQAGEVAAHVFHTLFTDGTGVGGLSVGIVALPVHAVSAREDFVVGGAGEEGLRTDGAVPLECLFDALVPLRGHGQGHAGVAGHAVAKVNTQALTQTADVAIGAMVDRLSHVVIVEAADVTVVGTEHVPAVGVPAGPRGGLELAATHATDLGDRVPVHGMVGQGLVVTKAAGIEAPTTRSSEFAGAPVMHAPKLPRRRVGRGAVQCFRV
ncbi:zinc ion binding protein, partial [Nannochloropsis gaditana CCMP526]|uniref:zinc ion binding protein n=1 Tax=Nannochloropsis gaditana (strain CCMP526) TaxID=1093141 RepID=UPI00029F5AEF